MLHILFLILKIIGIILLSVLGLILLILAVVLLVPVRYRIAIEKEAQIQAGGRISWLLGAVLLTGSYSGQQPQIDIRLFGRSLINREPKQKKGKRDKKEKDPEEEKLPEISKLPVKEETAKGEDLPAKEEVAKKEDLPAKEECAEAVKLPAKEDDTKESDLAAQEKAHRRRRITGIPGQIKNFSGRIRSQIDRIRQAGKNISHRIAKIKEQAGRYLDFWNMDCTRKAREHGWKEVRYLIRHIFPDKIEGKLLIGFDDPAITGQVLGVLCIVSALGGNSLEVGGDFEQSVLEGCLEVRGHIRICHIVKSILILIADKNIRQTIRSFRNLTA